MNKICVIYDDTIKPAQSISNIIGNKHFGEIVYKRKKMREHFCDQTDKYDFVSKIMTLYDPEDKKHLRKALEELPEKTSLIHIYASNAVKDEKNYRLILEKSVYIKETIALRTDFGIAGLIFPDVRQYEVFLRDNALDEDSVCIGGEEYQEIKTEAFCDMSHLPEFLQYITGGFEARYFNSLNGDAYTVTKTSTNKKKIKSEYLYYHLLPDDMKRWFVLPYDYEEKEETASYTMERLHMTDVAIRWVHGAFSREEFEGLMDRIFYFVHSRKTKAIDREAYRREVEKLYRKKVYERMEELKRHEKYPVLAAYISNASGFADIDEITGMYEEQLNAIQAKLCKNPTAVIGHGDLCFSNMLYHRETQLLKLIDVKGALKEEDLWMNPYYDLAKLSHSVCGCYDFFNNDMYEIRMNEQLMLELQLDFDNDEFVEIFKQYLEINGYHYEIVRVLEASLFLSMLPLHMDQPKKVFGFLLNAIGILKETKLCLKK